MSLVAYDVSSGSDDESSETDVKQLVNEIEAAPVVEESEIKIKSESKIDLLACKELSFNPKYESLFSGEQSTRRNFLTGHLEKTNLNDAVFDYERKHKYLKEASERIHDVTMTGKLVTPAPDASSESSSQPTKRKRLRNDDPSDIAGYTGPWAAFEDEVRTVKPTEEEQAEIDAYSSKKQSTQKSEKVEFEEKANLHIKDPYDYQGRSFLHPPHDLDGVNLKADYVPDRCFLPKKLMHTYTGHTKAVTKINWLPRSAHLFLSASMDGKVKLWEVYKQRRCIMTFMGHRSAVRDICFNKSGDRFISAGYDKTIKLWDTETGQCIKKFNTRSVAYCIKFNPDEEKSHTFLSGMQNKKILCWDSRTAAICQEYDRHLGAINTITFVDNNRRFVSTSDDKSIRVWEWDIPVDIKYIADPGLHAVPAVSMSPNGKWIACQMMDNKIQALACMNRFKLTSKKTFTGHMVAGYACTPHFSPDMNYLTSGDSDGKVFIWDWKTCKLLSTFQAHENVCISTLWHPHETSKLLTGGWDNNIKLWD